MDGLILENPAFLTNQLLTYLGNKRALLSFLEPAVELVRRKLADRKLAAADLFAGSGVVSRLLKAHCDRLICNDIEPYAEVTNRCYLADAGALDMPLLRSTYEAVVSALDAGPLRPGLIAESYAPRRDDSIRPGERVFYTRRNACYLDTARRLIEDVPESMKTFLLAPLLSEASVHANTSGVFKGFYKDAGTGIGKFGGARGDALKRILGDIRLPFPVFSWLECDVTVCRRDANELVRELPPLDLVYIDPPYNQHPYGSNYFMLNLLVDYKPPKNPSSVSGIPADWRRSDYNKRRKALTAFADLVRHAPAQFLLVSFNSEGFIDRETMVETLSREGRVSVLETKYNAFRGSRNLQNRSPHVTEYVYLVER